MKSQITLILGIILLLEVASAMYVGETINYTATGLGLNNITDVVISNNLSKIDYVFTNEIATITVPNDAFVQTFTITFYGYKYEEPAIIYSGGHSHHTSPPQIIIPPNTTTNNGTINLDNVTEDNKSLNDGLISYYDGEGNRTITQRERISLWKDNTLNKISDFFKSIWNLLKELFK